AALCYLPTRLQSLVEFYHTEIPVHYRQMGLGDILVNHAFQWAEQMGLLVIPSCTFVKRYLQHHDEHRDLLVRNEQ
ncbi:GCN5-related N-acetyl-transferase-domain-containing protein, partial [Dichotomocladium elegans]